MLSGQQTSGAASPRRVARRATWLLLSGLLGCAVAILTSGQLRPGASTAEAVASGLAIGLGIGGALIAVGAARDQKVRTEAQVTQMLGLPVLALIPRMRNADDRRRIRRRRSVGVAAAVIAAGVATVVAFRWRR